MNPHPEAAAIYERATKRLTMASASFQQRQEAADDHVSSALEEMEVVCTAIMTANALMQAAQESLKSPPITRMDNRHVVGLRLMLHTLEKQSEDAIGLAAYLRKLLEQMEQQVRRPRG